MPSACHEARSSPAPTTRSTRYDRQSTRWEALRDDTRPARARRRGQRTRRAVLTSLSRNLRIEDPTDVGFLTGFGAVILVDVAPQVRKAQVANKYAAAAVWRATAAMSGADLPAGTMPLVFGMTLCEADPELIENTLSSLPEMRAPAAAPQEFAAHSARVHGTSSPRRSGPLRVAPRRSQLTRQIPQHQKEKRQ